MLLQKQTSPSWVEILKTAEDFQKTLPPNWNEALRAFTEMQRNLRIPDGGMMAMAMDIQRNLPRASQKLSTVLEEARSTMSFASRIADLDRHLMPLAEISPQFSGLQKAILDATCQVTPVFKEVPVQKVPVEDLNEPLSGSEELNKTWNEAFDVVDTAVEKTLENNIKIHELSDEGIAQSLVFMIFFSLFFCTAPSGVDEWLEMLLRATIEFFKSLRADPTPEKVLVAVGFWACLKTAVSSLSKKDKDKPQS